MLLEMVPTILRLLNHTNEAHNHMLACTLWGFASTRVTAEASA